jgi:hypothetical protein
MAMAPPDGNRVGMIIQSMFARIKNLWVRAGRENSRRRISCASVMRGRAGVNSGARAKNQRYRGAALRRPLLRP